VDPQKEREKNNNPTSQLLFLGIPKVVRETPQVTYLNENSIQEREKGCKIQYFKY